MTRCALYCRLMLVLAVALAPWRSAAAQEGHAWFIVESQARDQSTRSNIVHLPPPDRMVPRGSVRSMVQGFRRAPERLAWSGNDLYILMPAERIAENENERRVYTISAVPGIISGWEYQPNDRPESLQSIRGQWGSRDLEVVGFAAGQRTPAVLMQRSRGAHVLIVLSGTEWVEAPLPWASARGDGAVPPAPAPGERCRFITTGSSFGVLVERPAGRASTWYLAAPDDVAALTHRKESPLRWTSREVVAAPPAPGAADTVYSIENQLVRVSLHDGRATLSVLLTSAEDVVATLENVGTDVRVAPSQGSNGFLAVLSLGVSAGGGAPTSETAGTDAPLALVEITPTGRILYQGPARQGGPVSVRDVQLLSVLLVMIMAAVVVFVLRPDRVGGGGANAVPLPAGVVPADGGRRVLAQVLDLGVSWLVASVVMRVDLTDLAMPDVLFATARGWLAIGVAAATTLALGVFMEWQFGMTIGKLLVGCRVVRVKRRAGGEEPASVDGAGAETGISPRVGLAASAARNFAKWMPWNVVEFLATGRQRAWADRIARTMVVVPVRSEPEDGAGQ